MLTRQGLLPSPRQALTRKSAVPLTRATLTLLLKSGAGSLPQAARKIPPKTIAALGNTFLSFDMRRIATANLNVSVQGSQNRLDCAR